MEEEELPAIPGWKKGATLAAARRKALYLERYLANPAICLNCHKPIVPKEGEKPAFCRVRKYCSRSCSATYNNLHAKAPRREARAQVCALCEGKFVFGSGTRHYCPDCLAIWKDRLGHQTKDSVTRDDICSHARTVMNGRAASCSRCSYSHFVDVCHIKPVRNFPPTARVNEINDLSNLVALCPNCHHEFDAGIYNLWATRAANCSTGHQRKSHLIGRLGGFKG
jgi:hypothetical protein